jgi:hypothetical protein
MKPTSADVTRGISASGAGFRAAIAAFQNAIAKDPAYAQPCAGLADTYALLGFYSLAPPARRFRTKAAALRALELDDTLGEAHAALAWARFFFDGDWPAAEDHFRRSRVESWPRRRITGIRCVCRL